MLTKQNVEQIAKAGHAFVEEICAALNLSINGGQGGGQATFQPQQNMQQPQGQQFNQQPQQNMQQPMQNQGQPQQNIQQGGGAIDANAILALVQPLVDNPVARPLLQQAMQAMGINALPDAKPEQYNELYQRFQQVAAQVAQQGGGQQNMQQPMQQQGFQQQPQQNFQQPQGGFQQGGFQQPQQNFQQPQGQQFAPNGGGLV